MTTQEDLKEWVKEQGFTWIKHGEFDFFGHYFKTDKDGFGLLIKWHYNDSEDCYYLKWGAWIGNEFHKEKYSIPERKDGIFLEAEAEHQRFYSHHDSGFHDMIVYIKKNNNKMIKLLKDNINKRLKKLQS